MSLLSHTRLHRIYLPPRAKEKPLNPLRFQRSRRFIIGSTGIFVCAFAAATMLALRRVQDRKRETERTLSLRHQGEQRVVIIGGGPGGSALAASLTSKSQALVTVIEEKHMQTFLGQVPHAHAGHRSYDVNTSGGWDFLRSPSSWAVTREAQLVKGRVVKVDPSRQLVMVKEHWTNKASKGSPNCSASSSPRKEVAKLSSSSWQLWRPWYSSTGPERSLSDGSYVDPHTKQRVFPYDVLIIASGAQRCLSSLSEDKMKALLPSCVPKSIRREAKKSGVREEGAPFSMLNSEVHLLHELELDCGAVALHPGTTRDMLAHLFKGEVLHVKVPPLSFTVLMEALQAKSGRLLHTTHSPSTALGEEKRASGCTSSVTSSLSSSTCPPLLSGEMLWSLQRLQLPSRQDDATFISTTNLIWKFLCFFNKLHHCPLYSISADAVPLASTSVAPGEESSAASGLQASSSLWNDEILSFWHSRQRWGSRAASFPDLIPPVWRETCASWIDAVRAKSGWGAEEPPSSQLIGTPFNESEKQLVFHPFQTTYLQSIDVHKREVLCTNYETGTSWKQGFRVLVVDLPLRASAFIEASGLHRKRYVEDEVYPAMEHWRKEPSGTVHSSSSRLLYDTLSQFSLSQLRRIFEAEASFVDVDPHTLQHRQFPNVFALGDAAGLPTIKSYGAVLSQVPVVSYNVDRVLEKELALRQKKMGEEKKKKQREKRTDEVAHPPEQTKTAPILAKYAGHSSFHIAMTPWRCMWPAVTYGHRLVEGSEKGDSAPNTYSLATCSAEVPFLAPHPSSSAFWRGFSGFRNGFFCQSGLYELLYSFVFVRGVWYPPRGFRMPTYSPIDGHEIDSDSWVGELL